MNLLDGPNYGTNMMVRYMSSVSLIDKRNSSSLPYLRAF